MKKSIRKRMFKVKKPNLCQLIYYLRKPELGVKFGILVPTDTYGHEFKIATLVRIKSIYVYGSVEDCSVDSSKQTYYFQVPGRREFVKTSVYNCDWYCNTKNYGPVILRNSENDDINIDDIPF